MRDVANRQLKLPPILTKNLHLFRAPVPTNDKLPPLEISVSTLLAERQQINPLAIREADKVESMRNKAELQGLPSSTVDSSEYAIGNIDIFGE